MYGTHRCALRAFVLRKFTSLFTAQPRHAAASRVLLAAATIGGLGGSALALPAVQKAETVTSQLASCKLIRNAAELQAMKNNLAGSYCLANDIDARSIANFVPIGDGANPFTGKFFGNGRVIRNLTINVGFPMQVGLFGAIESAIIQDVGLVNADIVGTADGAQVGGLVGLVLAASGSSEIRRVHVSGRVASPDASSSTGGIVGRATDLMLADSWSAVRVSGSNLQTGKAGGAIGYAAAGTITRVYATGPVTCAFSCDAGGLLGLGVSTTVVLSSASGRVTAHNNSYAGGLVGSAQGATIRRSHALGPATTGAGSIGRAGGLVGRLENGTLAEVYAVGRPAGGADAMLGGLVGETAGANSVAAAFWDTVTSKQTTSAAGTGYTTGQLRAALPVAFGKSWAITAKGSYPFLDDADIDFAAPLATVVKADRVYTFPPIGQRDKSQYATAPANVNVTSLAAVYTMISRAIGITRNVAILKEVTIDAYWKSAAKTAVWKGPVTKRATLGALRAIAANARLGNANVIGEMKIGRLVVLRGAYTKSNGAKAEHWLLGTLYTASGNVPNAIVANDPWTGLQVTIDPVSKKVVWPANYPLAGFKVDGYQPVTLK